MERWNKKLLTAARGGDVKTFKLCLQNIADIDYQDDDGWTALMFAAEEGHLEICRLLIDTGCKIDSTGVRGVTALMSAARKGHLEICRLLIDRGCKIDITSVRGVTALMKAAAYGHLEICRLLIDTGCKIDITDDDGWTALMFAARYGHLEICRLLIDTGCKIDITERGGYTALHLAARGGHLQTTQCLVEQGGASPLVTTHQGETSSDLAAGAKQRQYKEVMEYLQIRLIVLPASQQDHLRPHLSLFVGNSKHFGGNEGERKAAEYLYRDLVAIEKSLKEKVSLLTEFRKPSATPPKDYPFNCDIFAKSVNDNVLTRAIRSQFVKGGVLNAAWEYFTLQRNYDTHQALMGNGAKVPSGQLIGHRNRNRFGSESAEKNKNTLKESQQKGKEERMDTSESQSEVAVTQSQTPKEVCSSQASTSTCVFCDNKGVFYCYECKSPFCIPCRATHDKLPPSKTHSVIDLKSVNLSTVRQICKLHKSEYTFYCIPCNTLVCNICVTSDHKGHDMSEIKAKSDEFKKLAKSKLSDMKAKLQTVSKLAEKTKMVHIPKLNKESVDAIDRIRSFGKELQKLIETKTDIKINEVQDATQLKNEELKSVLKIKERIHRKQTAVYESLETLLSEEHAVSFLVSYQTLKRDMCDLTSESKDDIEPHHVQTPDLKGFLDETISSLQEYRKKLE